MEEQGVRIAVYADHGHQLAIEDSPDFERAQLVCSNNGYIMRIPMLKSAVFVLTVLHYDYRMKRLLIVDDIDEFVEESQLRILGARSPR